ncbi:hypothetical protein PTKIN_Ptkin01aG0111900 [Pterospermum kingtungense]
MVFYKFRTSYCGILLLLQIYNEQITDLLDPNQRNLQGLSNRRTGATSVNAESSRSHSVFTCVVESRCKGFILFKNATGRCSNGLVMMDYLVTNSFLSRQLDWMFTYFNGICRNVEG